MPDSYDITLVKGLRKKKIKNVIGHSFPQDIPHNNVVLLIIKKDETRLLVNFSSLDYLILSKDFKAYDERLRKEKMGVQN